MRKDKETKTIHSLLDTILVAMILEFALECTVSTTMATTKTRTIQRLRMHNYKYKIIYVAIFKNDVFFFLISKKDVY